MSTSDITTDSGFMDIKVSTPGGYVQFDYNKLYAAIANATAVPAKMLSVSTPNANNRSYSQQSINRAARHSNKINLNSIYGAFNNSFYSGYYPWNVIDGYRINSKTHKVVYVTAKWAEENMNEFIDYYSESEPFERRIQAEKHLLEKEISQLNSVLRDLNKQRAYNPNTRKAKFKFEGYNGEQARRTVENKKKAVHLQLEKLEYELENIEDLHPEWLI